MTKIIEMQIKIARRLTPEEILEMEKQIESSIDFDIRRIEIKSNEDIKKKWPIYTKWASLHYAYKAYEEEGENYYICEENFTLPLKELLKILTEKKIQLINEIAKGVESISDLARKVKRDVTNVYRDLKVLEKLKIIKLEKAGKNVIPKIVAEKITVELI